MQTLGIAIIGGIVLICIGTAIAWKWARPSGRFDPPIPTALRNDGPQVQYTEPQKSQE